MEKIYDDIEEVLIPQNVLQKRIEELGAQITKDLDGEDVVVIGVLKGCVIFLSDIFRHLDMKCDLDFMVCSSYENATESSGNVKIIKDINVDVKNKVVLVVEDIIDSGRTLSYLLPVLRERKPKSLKLLAFLDKPDRRVKEVPVDYTGFEIPDEFVVGYGLDYAQKYRNLPYVGIVEV